MGLFFYIVYCTILCVVCPSESTIRDVHCRPHCSCWQTNERSDEARVKTCQDCQENIKQLTSSLRTIEKQVEILKENSNKNEANYSDCQSVYEGGEGKSGVVKVRPDMSPPIEVYCDMSDGGWTVIQRRVTGHVSFKRNWAGYKNGFGRFSGDFWLGNERIYRLTSNADYKLRVEIQLFNGSWYHATYQHFRLENESDRYRLRVRDYSGNAGDVFINSGSIDNNGNNMEFSTPDVAGADCAKMHSSGWWFNKCSAGNLNGLYHKGSACPFAGPSTPRCLMWRIQDMFLKQALKETVMKIKSN